MTAGLASQARRAQDELGPYFWLKLLAVAAALLAFFALLVGGWFYWKLKESLPPLDGSIRVGGLGASARLERDHQGVPTVRGSSYADVALALGFAHGQDRFFQMDLSRRRSAGELAALVGAGAVPLDQRARLHDFRRLAQEDWARATPDQRAILTAYAKGVNEGLASLRVKPFEYVVLRVQPEPWKPEDCFLVSYTMLITLQDGSGGYLRDLNDVRATLGTEALAFFSPLVGPGDAALDGSTAALPRPPGPDVLNLRKEGAVAWAGPERRGWSPRPAVEDVIGSNSFAVAGRNGAPAVLANDMHLALTVPNTWYRASLLWPGHQVTGVTLPGVPLVVAGSNGHIVWGFTNAGVGTGDLIAVQSDIPDYYRGPGAEELPLEDRTATIHVKGRSDATVTHPWTIWGPVVGKDPLRPGRLLVYHWTEDDPAAANLTLFELYDAGSVDQAIDIARRSGTPALNFLVADDHGRIGWTIAGRLPDREGYSGMARWPVSWQFGDRSWQGFLPSEDVPAVTGRDFLWTANQRMLGGDALAKLGDNGYFRGARAAQIRNDLVALKGPPQPADLLKIELDDRAEFLGWWRELILNLEAADPKAKGRHDFYDAVRRDSGRAGTASVGYRLVREFRDRITARVLDPIFAGCVDADPDFEWRKLNYEPALRALIEDKPLHFLDPRWSSWNDLLLDGVAAGARSVRGHTWGRRNTLRIDHPFSLVFPRLLAGWLNMPAEEVPGDVDMPRVQAPAYGASERFAVAPGHEAQGIFEMPCGQSGHPLSPYYRAGHEAWVHGDPSPFLPGPPEHALLLEPQTDSGVTIEK